MKYAKRHLPYDQQARQLKSRGLDIGDEGETVRALKRIGYYRLSAYTYPMRKPLNEEDRSSTRKRADEFQDGFKLADAVAMHDFDHRLRKTLIPALQTLEIGLRTKIAYHLGKHGSMAHIDMSGLDTNRCTELSRERDRTRFEVWKGEYDQLQSKAQGEDYVKHFANYYEGEVPIWAATEFMTMGSLIRLYRLMTASDSRRIADELGVKNQNVLFGWLKALNVLRNHCAHDARIWNRTTIYPPDRINDRMVNEELHHLKTADTNRLYFLMAVLAYLVKRIDPHTRFESEVKTTMSKLPAVDDYSSEDVMGFVDNWRAQSLWAV